MRRSRRRERLLHEHVGMCPRSGGSDPGLAARAQGAPRDMATFLCRALVLSQDFLQRLQASQDACSDYALSAAHEALRASSSALVTMLMLRIGPATSAVRHW